MKIDFAALKFNVHGYINAIVQDAGTDEVLALAKMDGEALARTAEKGWAYLRSRYGKAAACPCLNRTAFTAYLPKFTA